MRKLRVSRVLGVAGLAVLAAVAMAQREDRPERGRGPGPTPEQFVDRVFSQTDANADGVISKDEAEGKPIERVFAEIDTDNDGNVTKVELTAWLEKRAAAERNGQVENFAGGMRMAGRAMRGLRRSALDSSTRADDLHAVAMIEAGLVGAKLHIDKVDMAPQAKEKYADDRAAFETALREGLLKALGAAIDLERAITEDRFDDAKAARDQLVQAMRDGHAAFQPKDDDDDGGRGERGRERGPGR